MKDGGIILKTVEIVSIPDQEVGCLVSQKS
jgi:hypothetical protein